MVRLSIVAGVISGICWLLGDIFLVGFEVEKERYWDFVENSQISNKELAILMLSGSDRRLRFGALIANFSIPFMLASLYGLFRLTSGNAWAWLAVSLLGIGFSLSPVAHVAFYYVGVLSKRSYQRVAGKTCETIDAKLINDFTFMLNLTWRIAILLTGLGWFVYSLVIFTGQTMLPVYFGLFTPLFTSFLAVFIVEKLKFGRPYLNGAGLNMALIFFFFMLLLSVN